MCQGIFPSAFNPCDCSSSDLAPYTPAPPPPHQKKQEQGSTFPNVAPQPKQQPHPPSLHPQSLARNLSPFSASSLVAKWVATISLHPDAIQKGQQHGLERTRVIANEAPSMSSAGEPCGLDAPHLVHAFFFDST